MSNSPPHDPIAHLVSTLRWLNATIVRGLIGGWSPPPIVLAVNLIREAANRFLALAARVQSGAYKPRRHAPRGRPATPPQPPPRNPLREKPGWLLPLVPDAMAFREHIATLLQGAEVVALLAAAPVPMGRILRPVCWMLRLPPPPALVRPRRRPPAPIPTSASAPTPAALGRAGRGGPPLAARPARPGKRPRAAAPSRAGPFPEPA